MRGVPNKFSKFASIFLVTAFISALLPILSLPHFVVSAEDSYQNLCNIAFYKDYDGTVVTNDFVEGDEIFAKITNFTIDGVIQPEADFNEYFFSINRHGSYVDRSQIFSAREVNEGTAFIPITETVKNIAGNVGAKQGYTVKVFKENGGLGGINSDTFICQNADLTYSDANDYACSDTVKAFKTANIVTFIYKLNGNLSTNGSYTLRYGKKTFLGGYESASALSTAITLDANRNFTHRATFNDLANGDVVGFRLESKIDGVPKEISSDSSENHSNCGPIEISVDFDELTEVDPGEADEFEPDPLPGAGFKPEYNLCQQISPDLGNTQRLDCDRCYKKAPKGVWTALGCIQTDPQNIIKELITIGLSISGGVSILMILGAGFSLSTSQGDPKKTSEAREQITSAVIGLLFIIFSITILQFIGVSILRIPGFGG